MERYADLLLDVWRQASRHLRIEESLDRITPVLSDRLPLQLVIIRQVELDAATIRTIATSEIEPLGSQPRPSDRLSPQAMERLVAWRRQGEITSLPARRHSDPRNLLAPRHVDRAVLAGPLTGPAGDFAIVLFVARPTARFTSVHREVAQALLEPFSVAFQNDRRFHELRTGRETAEADRRSLLAKLGRKEISETIVGSDGGLRPVMERVNQVCRSDVPVLILGETGSGKEVIARAIHTRSARSEGPFLRVNCGAIPPELIDSELFGHERGSFTGAVSLRRGWFERADGGTLFLDEIGELPLAAQVRLLRILQDGVFERVGGQLERKVDVRIVAATHQDLGMMVTDGRFRADLWYRIAVFPIHLPPLRDRPEDMGALAFHFASRASRRFGLPLLTPGLDDIDLLVNYAWPGNIRELAAVIDRAAILGNGVRLEIAKALGVSYAHPAVTDAEEPRGESSSEGASFLSLEEVMARHIRRALRATRGRVEGPHGAAKLLSINPHTLRARMRKLGIDWKRYRRPVVED